MTKIIAKNKDAHFNYELLDRYEAGLVLNGWEVKSIRSGNVQLKGSFVTFKKQEAYVSNVNIAQYMNVICDETRPRKLLLHQNQIKKLKSAIQVQGMTIIPTTLKLSSKGIVKLDIAIAKGKNKADKRQTVKKRDDQRKLKTYY